MYVQDEDLSLYLLNMGLYLFEFYMGLNNTDSLIWITQSARMVILSALDYEHQGLRALLSIYSREVWMWIVFMIVLVIIYNIYHRLISSRMKGGQAILASYGKVLKHLGEKYIMTYILCSYTI